MSSKNRSADSALLHLDPGGNVIHFNSQAALLGLVAGDAELPILASQLPSFLRDAVGELHHSASLDHSFQVIWARAGQLPNHYQLDLLALGAPASAPCVMAVRLLEAGEPVNLASTGEPNLRP